MKIQNRLSGHLLALFTAIVWGASFISSRILLDTLSPLEILFYRFLLGYLALWILYPHRVKFEGKRSGLWLFLAGFCGVTLYFLFENTALLYTLTSNVSILVCINPFFTGVISHFTKGEKMKSNFVFGFFVSIIGIALISFNGRTVLNLNPIGDILALGAAATWAIYSVTTQKVNAKNSYPVLAITRRIFFYGLITMIPCMLFMDFSFWEPGRFSPVVVGNLLLLGLVGSAICYFTFNKAMSILGTMRTSAYIYLIPLVTLLLSASILNEEITWIAILGTLLILSGLILSEWRGIRDK